MTAILQTIVKAQVRAGLRQSRGIPVEKVLGGDGQLRIDGEAGGQLATWYEQLFGFGAWNSQRFGQIQS
ncbi:hypothetical protein D3C72_2217660 [compost metagenome]